MNPEQSQTPAVTRWGLAFMVNETTLNRTVQNNVIWLGFGVHGGSPQCLRTGDLFTLFTYNTARLRPASENVQQVLTIPYSRQSARRKASAVTGTV